MSNEKELGILIGEVKYMRQDFRDMNLKMDKVLLVTGDVKRNKDSIRHLWQTVWSFFCLSLGGNIFGVWWVRK